MHASWKPSLTTVCHATVHVLALYACLFRLGAPTLEYWDEARLANSALEMLHTGRWLTPTFDGVADHWSTKPPLVIWLMFASFKLLGASDWAARLPAALCGVALIVAVHAWTHRETGSAVTGLVAALCLVATPGFLLEHGARAAEYDVPLALAMTGTLYAAWRWTGPPDARPAWAPALLTVCLLCGVMTKTVQALVILPPLALWWATRPSRPPLWHASVLPPTSLVCATVAAYVILRQADDPAYLAITWHNDIAGRFAAPQEGHRRDVLWYLRCVRSFPLLLPSLLAWGWLMRTGSSNLRSWVGFLGMVEIGYLVVISLSETKLRWYALPSAPWSAILVALAINTFWRDRAGNRHEHHRTRPQPGISIDARKPERTGTTNVCSNGIELVASGPADERASSRPSSFALTKGPWLTSGPACSCRRRTEQAALALLAAIAIVALHVAYRIEHRVGEQTRTPTHALDHSLRARARQLPRESSVAILQPGVRSPHTPIPYVAPTLFYANVSRAEGRRVDLITDPDAIVSTHQWVIRCRPRASLRDAAEPRQTPLDCTLMRTNTP